MPDLPRCLAEELDGLVERWFFETFHGSSVARSTEAWNVAHAAKEELKRRLVHFVVSTAESMHEAQADAQAKAD